MPVTTKGFSTSPLLNPVASTPPLVKEKAGIAKLVCSSLR